MGVAAFGQTPAAPKVDKASAYYHYSLAHMYAELAGAYGNRNDYLSKAIDNYKEAIKADPSAGAVTEELADLYIQSGRLLEAQKDAEESLRQNPNDLGARRLLARVFVSRIGDRSQNRIDEDMLKKAIEQYQKISELDPKDTESLVMLGRLQKVAQNSVDSEKAYKKALTIDPENEDALTGLAMLYADRGDTSEAADILKKLSDKNPSQKSFRALGSAYEQMKEFGLAAQALRRALELNPPDAADLKREIAQDLMFAKDYDGALRTYQELVEEEPSDAGSFLRMSQIYREKHDFAKARSMSDKAKAIEPSNIEVRFNEVGILEAEGKPSEAIQLLKDILSSTARKNYSQADKQNRIALLERLATMYRAADQTDQAVDTFHQIADLDSELAPAMSAEVIETYRAGKEYQKAEQEAESALKKWPSDRAVHLTHAMVIAEMGKVDAAAAEVKKLLNGKNDRETYYSLAQVYDKGKKFDEEAKAIDQMEKLASNKDEKQAAWFARGAMFEKAKKEQAAEAEFRKILAENPDRPDVLNYLGYMFADRNIHLNEALDMINKAVASDPGNGAYLDSLGWVYYKLDRLPEAEENLRKAVESTPRDATVHDHLGDVLMKASKVREAVAQWEISVREWNASSPADQEPAEMAKVKSKLETAKVRLAKESPKQE
ncbi:MAG: tetratricopeptide repeat protein [Acidobacteriia bacterium]|nr:tetratricopeptide repeat protein [Terriglobia bacterium]